MGRSSHPPNLLYSTYLVAMTIEHHGIWLAILSLWSQNHFYSSRYPDLPDCSLFVLFNWPYFITSQFHLFVISISETLTATLVPVDLRFASRIGSTHTMVVLAKVIQKKSQRGGNRRGTELFQIQTPLSPESNPNVLLHSHRPNKTDTSDKTSNTRKKTNKNKHDNSACWYQPQSISTSVQSHSHHADTMLDQSQGSPN